MAKVIIIQCSALMDTGSLGHPVCCHVFPSFKVYVALFYICLNVVLMPLLPDSRGTFPFNKLRVKDLFWEARVRHADNMASPSELVLGDGGSDGGDVSPLQNTGVSSSILPAYPEEFPEAPLIMCLKCF